MGCYIVNEFDRKFQPHFHRFQGENLKLKKVLGPVHSIVINLSGFPRWTGLLCHKGWRKET